MTESIAWSQQEGAAHEGTAPLYHVTAAVPTLLSGEPPDVPPFFCDLGASMLSEQFRHFLVAFIGCDEQRCRAVGGLGVYVAGPAVEARCLHGLGGSPPLLTREADVRVLRRPSAAAPATTKAKQ